MTTTEIKASCDNAIHAVRFFAAGFREEAVRGFLASVKASGDAAAFDRCLDRAMKSPASSWTKISACATLRAEIAAAK